MQDTKGEKLDLIVVYLLREEMKARKLFNSLKRIGFKPLMQFDLSRLILLLSGCDLNDDATSIKYSKLLDKYAETIEVSDGEEIERKAIDLLHEIKLI